MKGSRLHRKRTDGSSCAGKWENLVGEITSAVARVTDWQWGSHTDSEHHEIILYIVFRDECNFLDI